MNELSAWDDDDVGPGCGLSLNVTTDSAVEHAADQCEQSSGQASADFVVVFFSGAHTRNASLIATRLLRRFSPKTLLGAVCVGAMAGAAEIDRGPVLSVLTLNLPQCEFKPFSHESFFDPDGLSTAIRGTFDGPSPRRGTLVLGDLAVGDVPAVFEGFGGYAKHDESMKPIFGGLSPSSFRSEESAFLLNDQVVHSGVVGTSFFGEYTIDCLMGQGCKAIGPAMTATKVQEGLVVEINDQPAAELLRSILEEARERLGSQLEGAKRGRLPEALFLGRGIDALNTRPGRDHYVIRRVMRLQADQSLVVTGNVMQGDMVRFHVADPRAAREDLSMLLDMERLRGSHMGALAFSSVGRSDPVNGRKGYESGAISRALSRPVAGEQLAKAGFRLDAEGGRPAALAGMLTGAEIGTVQAGSMHRTVLNSQSLVLATFRAAAKRTGQ